MLRLDWVDRWIIAVTLFLLKHWFKKKTKILQSNNNNPLWLRTEKIAEIDLRTKKVSHTAEWATGIASTDVFGNGGKSWAENKRSHCKSVWKSDSWASFYALPAGYYWGLACQDELRAFKWKSGILNTKVLGIVAFPCLAPRVLAKEDWTLHDEMTCAFLSGIPTSPSK